ncbi:hypothetical protein [Pyrodictium abyssi]|uniref:Uncharacterized protein n=1 Tax=Pyrodictium abyssi TaxID=54256 RepID=A0ABN6ZLX0_9CREN|nr:hypothetical protein PABY_08370 [Pyrodictium abyssi]
MVPAGRSLAMAIYRLRVQINRIDSIVERIQHRDEVLFDRYMEAFEERDSIRMAGIAAEIAELRRWCKALLAARYALERVVLRLETLLWVNGGDQRLGLAPAAALLAEIRRHLTVVGDPELLLALDEVRDMLEEHVAGIELGDFGKKAMELLMEAAKAAEQRMKDWFPELPSALPPKTAKATA